MYVTADDPSSDYRYVTAVAESEEDGLALFDYVMMTYKGQQWIGQITSPNINIPTAGRQFDPSILHAIKLFQQNDNIQLAESVEKWEIFLLGEYANRDLSTLRRRPKPGTTVERLDRTTTINVLNLPKLLERPDGSTNTIGYLLNADDVPLCVDRAIYTHHILVSGGTGSGKSNTSANLVLQAPPLGFTVFLYDAKPDYKKISTANTDVAVKGIWPQFAQYNLQPEGAKALTRVAIYGVGQGGRAGNYQNYDDVIGFNASDFNPYIFASLFFDQTSSLNQYEEFAAACAGIKKRPFSLDVVLDIVRKKKDEGDIHEATAKAIETKVGRRRGFMPWLDTVGTQISGGAGAGNAFSRNGSKKVKPFNPSSYANRPGIVHVDCEGLPDEDYALFLSRFISECHRHQRKNGHLGIIQFVDEAHRIFDNSSRYSGALSTEFNRVMREGRSLKHGVILSLQNASQVPPLVMNNFNSVIVMKQNNRDVARAATQTMGKEFADQSVTLSRGHALVKMFESSATVLAQMAPSPFELMRPDNTDG